MIPRLVFSYCPTALLPYCPTALLPYCPTALLPYCPNYTLSSRNSRSHGLMTSMKVSNSARLMAA
ncbi:hypothetical protein CN884_11770 [Ochrobactrum sp. 30A/1000/2015]|nr:hypothetical protein CN884_11770 [Ochrobactrum sp. 30A/1000/2015]PJT37515.1 hypothetical protein CN883_16185 [Ochrobactrum sp. 27A/999/2015]